MATVSTTLIALGLAGVPGAIAAKGNVKFGGSTDQGQKAKLVVDSQGRAVRGSWMVTTDCDGQYEDFRVQVDIRKPLDRSTQDGFRDIGSTTDSDETYSARYKHEIEGSYEGKRSIEGTLSTTVTFRRNGKKYVTCVAEDLEWTVEELEAG